MARDKGNKRLGFQALFFYTVVVTAGGLLFKGEGECYLVRNVEKKQEKLELLAPAGGWLAFKAGIENGADAVYLGGKSFNARAGAANFSLAELRQSVRYAHEREAKVYVTVNILIADHEFPELVEYLYQLHEIGVDALILQDVGVARLLQAILPELKIHGSTQMTVNNTWGVQHLEKLGFSRVVLAREVSLSEIRTITETSGLEVEAFVHGALCICYSGQCLMSSFIGGRSGNRGTCAQPCRMGYRLLDQKNQDVLASLKLGDHLLSTRDINLSEQLGRLQERGIHSLKVEGRMKRPEYVATVIRLYRQALDRLALREDLKGEDEAAELSLLTTEEQGELTQIFNRDFTTAYLDGNPGAELMSYRRPNNRGIRLGRVVQGENGWLTIKLEGSLRLGDGIEVWNSRGREGMTVEQIQLPEGGRGQEQRRLVQEAVAGQTVELLFKGWANAGDRVFKTHDEALIQKARESYQEGKEGRKRPLEFRLYGRIGERICLEARSGAQNVRVYSTGVAQQALKRPLTQELALQQLGRLGTTPFRLLQLELDVAGELMLPISELNELRRLAVEALLQERAARSVLPETVYQQRYAAWKTELSQERARLRQDFLRRQKPADQLGVSVAVSNIESLRTALQAGARRLLLGGESWRSRAGFSFAELQEGLKLCREYRAEGVWRWPRILNQEQAARMKERLYQAAQWEDRPAVMAANLGELAMIQAVDPAWPLELDYTFNIFNAASVAYFLQKGARKVTLSPELNREQIAGLASWPATEMMVFGDMAMMVSEHCPIGSALGGKKGTQCSGPCRQQGYALQDRLRINFPLETDRDCRMHLFNSRQLNLYPILDDIAGLGVESIRLELIRATTAQIRFAVPLFQRRWSELTRGQGAKSGQERRSGGADRMTDAALERSRQWETLFPEGFTKGHFFRGVTGSEHSGSLGRKE
jgi:putative protease